MLLLGGRMKRPLESNKPSKLGGLEGLSLLRAYNSFTSKNKPQSAKSQPQIEVIWHHSPEVTSELKALFRILLKGARQ